MSNEILDFTESNQSLSKAQSKEFFRSVYTYMVLALVVSGFLAYWMAASGNVIKWFYNEHTMSMSPLMYVVIFAPVGLAFLIQGAYNRLSMPVLMGLFVLYAALIGTSLSTIFFVYTSGQIASTFFISAGAFAAMAVLGYTTKTDLTKMGSLLYMAFIGIFIASIVNIWVGSDGLDWIISIVGVFVFTGLTAYYMQNYKAIAQDTSIDAADKKKLALIGGLQLYILFINLFMSLLRILNRD
ncbi:Bax inhibitor-1/YccA family protein [Lishizhenia sp.]|uniref:Bax inhibitor-1/YccA family protein n=1 Tax=Lishizhenia sp. TaxID=2497594 RepID=UPI00299F031B|nr:Bax inhibitor-1/YccA family protein [Lishizhenia sp.]MDX1447182.1 Bax inhibitor-1/YccA family protein [Lishizhenia sp.]